MNRKLSIKNQFVCVFAIIIVLLVIFGAVSMLTISTMSNTISNLSQAAGAEISAEAQKAIALGRGAEFCVIILGIVGLVVAIAVAVGMTRGILYTVDEIKQASDAIARGDLEYEVNYEAENEFGELAGSMRATLKTLNDVVFDINYLIDELMRGNFIVESRKKQCYIGDYNGILNGIYGLRNNLVDTLTKIYQTADCVGQGSNGAMYGAQALGQVATEQAAAVEELAATISEINSNAGVAGDFAAQASEKTNEAGILMEQCKTQMDEMLTAMGEISSNSEEIGKIIKTIEDIAFQTNILALNAAVEAARAGSAGKGFAVVADEVRNLAAKSAEASKNSSELIATSLASVEKGVKLANGTAEQLSGAAESSQAVMEMVSKIADNAIEQSGALVQISVGIDQVAEVVQTISNVAEQSSNGSAELTEYAQVLHTLVNKFTLSAESENKAPEVFEGPQL